MRDMSRSLWPRLAAVALAALVAVPTAASAAAKITIINGDGPGEGFNDPTVVAPVGGNPGTTRGQQRLIAFQFGADRWGETLDSNVEIKVLAFFDPLGANVLGQAGANFILRDFGPDSLPGFPGPAFTGTWYFQALADKLAGRDLVDFYGLPGEPQIVAQFSSDFSFYLGLDNNHGAQNDLIAVVLHELGHGLGFANAMSEATGATPDGLPDIYQRYTLDTTTGKLWSDLTTNAERQQAALKVDKTVWVGARSVNAVPTTLALGRPEITVNSPAAIAGTARIGSAAFGPVLSSAISNSVVLANDGVGATADACEPLVNGAAVAGKIALVDRGTCTFVVKVKTAQNAGAVAVIVANNVAADPPPGMAGVDPTITVTSVMISQALGNSIKGQLAGGVSVTLALDLSQRAGADPNGLPQLYATNPVQSGSSISHWDTIAFPNQLMEPAINPDLTHEVVVPYDMTLTLLRDIGWFVDANVDGVEDATVILGTCNTGTADVVLSNGASLSEMARVWFRDCAEGAKNHGQFVSCVSHATNDAKKAGLITGAQKGAIQSCAGSGTN